MSYVSVSGHRSMALDRLRNDLYADALRGVITDQSVVLDLGAGTGIHGLIAARLGAKRVYLVEPEDVIAVAEEIVQANQLQDVVRCLHGTLDDLELPEKVDVIVSAFAGNFLLSEDLLPLLFQARDTVLAPGGVLIPDRATMDVVPVTAPALHTREVAGWSEAQHEVTLAPARPYAANTVHYRWDRHEVTYLAEPQTVHRVNLAADQYTGLHANVEFQVATSGLCHGFAGWFTMRLGERWVSTAPHADAMHWSPAFLPLDPPIAVEKGDTITCQFDRPPYGEWTWRVTSPAGSQRHSTLLSAPIKASTLKKAALDYAPVLNPEGEALAFILAQCSGQVPITEIVRELQARWPKRYGSEDDALRAVQSCVKRYA